jgi:coenzyme F420-reducing hydrogenase alpha subunit
MLKSVTVTRHETVETWNSWLVAVPDDMEDECIAELMQELVNNYDLDLDQEEGAVDDEVSVDISDAPSGAKLPHLTLTEEGLVDEESVLTAFTTDRLQAELERR